MEGQEEREISWRRCEREDLERGLGVEDAEGELMLGIELPF